MLWIKHDINNRLNFLSELIKCIRMPLIPVSYYFNCIDNEALLKSNCLGYIIFKNIFLFLFFVNVKFILDLLFEALRIYTFARTGKQLASTIYNSKSRQLRNQVINCFNVLYFIYHIMAIRQCLTWEEM